MDRSRLTCWTFQTLAPGFSADVSARAYRMPLWYDPPAGIPHPLTAFLDRGGTRLGLDCSERVMVANRLGRLDDLPTISSNTLPEAFSQSARRCGVAVSAISRGRTSSRTRSPTSRADRCTTTRAGVSGQGRGSARGTAPKTVASR